MTSRTNLDNPIRSPSLPLEGSRPGDGTVSRSERRGSDLVLNKCLKLGRKVS